MNNAQKQDHLRRGTIQWTIDHPVQVLLLILGVGVLFLTVYAVANVGLWNATLGSLQNVLHANLGLSEAAAGVLAPVLAIAYLWAAWRASLWLFPWKRDALAIVALVLFTGFFPLLHLFDAKFNRMTGAAQICAAERPDGTMDILSRDTNGNCPYSDAGVKSIPLTINLECVRERERKDVKPVPLSNNDDPRDIDFIDPATGKSEVLYYKEMDGTYRLFKRGQYYSCGGDFLRPVTPDVRVAIIRQFEIRIVHEHKLEADREHQRIIAAFNSESYSQQSVIVGVRAEEQSEDSEWAADRLRRELIENLHDQSISADDFRPDVYSSGYFDQLWNGQTALLDEAGISKKARAVLLAMANATCRPAVSATGLFSCTVSVMTHVLRHNSSDFVSYNWTEIGAGVSSNDALATAVKLVLERHPEIVNEL